MIAFEKETDMNVRGTTALALASLAEFLDPGSSSRVFGPYADRLIGAIQKQALKEADPDVRPTEGSGAMLIVLPRDEAVLYVRRLVSYADATTRDSLGVYDMYSHSLDQARYTSRTDHLPESSSPP